MASLLHSESRRLYSWWWDSHNIPKNSKWLQENLTDMDAKVKAMIKLIEEDADSFARRAEMYYKKRPELMKLVEDFYRAYRALAERYDHATGELRQAHKTMVEAFPNQAHYLLADDSPCGDSSYPEAEPHTPEMPHLFHSFLEPDDLQKHVIRVSSIHNTSQKNGRSSEEFDDGASRKGLKQLNEILKLSELSSENHNLKTENRSDFGHAGKAETEVQTLRKALAEMVADRDATFLQYQNSLEKLSEMEKELNKAEQDAGGLDERASKAEIEIEILKESLAELKAENDTDLVRYDRCLERVTSLETMLLQAQMDAKGHDEQATKAKTEVKNLKQELAILEDEKDAALVQYKQSIENISLLEAKIALAEENYRMLSEQIHRAEMEVKALRENLAEVNGEKETIAILYNQCLQKMSSLEFELVSAKEASERLGREIEVGAEKLKTAEEHCDMLEKSNRSLQLEADNLMQKISLKDHELSEKHTELEKLQTLMHEDNSRFLEIESTLQTLQELYSRSQEDQISLALELKHGLKMLEDLELSKQDFKEEMQQIMEENKTLHVLNFSSTGLVKDQQVEISKLKENKEKLEREFSVKVEESNAIQRESHQIKDELLGLNNRYQAILEELESVGLSPKCFAASVKNLQDENSKLKEVCKMDKDEKEALLQKSKDMDKLLREKTSMEFSMSGLNDELDGVRDALKKFQDLCQVLKEEKSVLVAEKSALLSQLQIITESMQKLLEKNTLLEKSLFDAKFELDGLRAKSSSLENFCNLLNNEKHNLINERSILVSQLESVEARLGNLEKRFTKLEEKYSDADKDRESKINQVEELHVLLSAQKEKHANHKLSSEARLGNLENLVLQLQEEHKLGKKEFEEELDKAVNAQVEMFILQKCVEDLEQKNLGLLIECQKYVEASKFSDKVISELESENLMQQMELEFFVDEIRKFKMGVQKVFGDLQDGLDGGHDKRIKQEEMSISHILNNIEGMKGTLSKVLEEKQQLLVENFVFLNFLSQQQSQGEEMELQKKIQEQEVVDTKEQNAMLLKDKLELLEMNKQLKSLMTKGEENENVLKSKLAALHVEFLDLQRKIIVFQEENCKVLDENNTLVKSVFDLKDAKSTAEDENNVILHEALALKTLSLVYESFVIDKVVEQKELAEHVSNLRLMNTKLEQELGLLRKKIEVKEAENVYLNESAEKMETRLLETTNANDHLSHQIGSLAYHLKKKEEELLEMEERLKAVEMLNAEFCKNVEKLKMEQQESRLVNENLERHILELSEGCINHKKEIENLNEANESFITEMRLLRHEVEQQRAREETLSSELLDKTNEFEIWEAEAATFYFDLQISSISEALLENKVSDLTGVCMKLEDEGAAKSLAIVQMTERASVLESEIGELKGELSAYIPVISSLKEDFVSLEHTVLQTNKTSSVSNQEQKDVAVEGNSYPSLTENRSALIPEGVSDLLSIKDRIRAIAKLMADENRTTKFNPGTLTIVPEDSNVEVLPYAEKDSERVEKEVKDGSAFDVNLWRTKSENGSLMRDIPLDHISDTPASKNGRRVNSRNDDQMLELWETAEQDSGDDSIVTEAMKQIYTPTEDAITCHQSDNNSSGKFQNTSSELEVEKEYGVDRLQLSKSIRERTQDGKRRKILERLASDAHKLTTLKMAVLELKKKMETKKPKKKGNDADCVETVKRQVEEVEGAVMKLVDTNDQLRKEVEESGWSLKKEISVELEKSRQMQRKRIAEQARRGSQQIGRLQFEVQNMQYVLLKLADEEKNKGKNRFSGKTVVLLRNFIHSAKKSNKKHNKGCFCGCSRPSTHED
ncbi:unnamed protein product [Lupinus luteus]|uniref:NAB domain-containing protein n=1 Tax=Lupinus luteus TaxID=3873 RepID=A0AAV1X300_LUPLU